MNFSTTLIMTLLGLTLNAAPLQKDKFPKLSNGIYVSTEDQKCRKRIQSIDLDESIAIINIQGSGSCTEKSIFLCSSSNCISSDTDTPRILTIFSETTFFLSTAETSTFFVKLWSHR